MELIQEDPLLAQRVDEILRGLAAAARDPAAPPSLIAVTKSVPLMRIQGLPLSKIAGLGENRAAEICEKYENSTALPPIHMIGRLQSNKVKYIIDKVCMIQSLDRMSLAQEIDRQAQRRGSRMPVLVQVNIGDESQKGGVPYAQAGISARAYAKLPGLYVCGLMAIMPNTGDTALLRALFAKMRALFESLRGDAGLDMVHLSMGMSADALLAAEEGATMVRVGGAIFAPRG